MSRTALNSKEMKQGKRIKETSENVSHLKFKEGVEKGARSFFSDLGLGCEISL